MPLPSLIVLIAGCMSFSGLAKVSNSPLGGCIGCPKLIRRVRPAAGTGLNTGEVSS